MTTRWVCPKCGHPAHVMVVVVKDHVPGESVLDGGERRYVPTTCTYTLCEYHDGFPPSDPPIPVD